MQSRKHLAGRYGAPVKPAQPWVFFVDVNPICFRGFQRSLGAFARWLALFFEHVSLCDPVVAVLDGEGGNEYRRQLLPSYKAHRTRGVGTGADSRVVDVLRECNVPGASWVTKQMVFPESSILLLVLVARLQ